MTPRRKPTREQDLDDEIEEYDGENPYQEQHWSRAHRGSQDAEEFTSSRPNFRGGPSQRFFTEQEVKKLRDDVVASCYEELRTRDKVYMELLSETKDKLGKKRDHKKQGLRYESSWTPKKQAQLDKLAREITIAEALSRDRANRPMYESSKSSPSHSRDLRYDLREPQHSEFQHEPRENHDEFSSILPLRNEARRSTGRDDYTIPEVRRRESGRCQEGHPPTSSRSRTSDDHERPDDRRGLKTPQMHNIFVYGYDRARRTRNADKILPFRTQASDDFWPTNKYNEGQTSLGYQQSPEERQESQIYHVPRSTTEPTCDRRHRLLCSDRPYPQMTAPRSSTTPFSSSTSA
ncbi:hypothetical protein P154DRAFT_609099 [Amniculicola lignicola CBS 123094]|uniref:Uncharacterized protein n=1 Tax=Amniculicola lignicola CBS 123094 TaxID=1392246 RepID=A0A6A5W3K8_9PLEO|nr:hypothetical protein P154DRAFT_609099 [Amniculicola lignicola CBS 123094]